MATPIAETQDRAARTASAVTEGTVPNVGSLNQKSFGPGVPRSERQFRKDRSIVVRKHNEAQAASKTNSSDVVGSEPDQTGYQLDCSEVWCGNNVADERVKLPGLVGFIHSRPAEPATSGGDVCYVSVCDKRLLSRVLLADVAGHGEAVEGISTRLSMLVKKYINTLDQSALMREINEALYKQNEGLEQFATAVMLSHDCRTGELIFASAGHPPTLWYRARQKEWDWLHESTPGSVKKFEGPPLGLVHGTEYEQARARLAEGDLLILYTDGITECADKPDKELGYEGLRELVRSLPVEPTFGMASTLVTALEKFRDSTPCRDDQSVIVLQRTDGCLQKGRHPSVYWRHRLLRNPGTH